MAATRTPSFTFKVALVLASLWLLTVCLSALAVPFIVASVPYWHEVRLHLQQLGLVQTWISIAACVGLLGISRRKHSETEQPWAQGALLIYVLGGLLSAILLNYGVLPQFLAKSNSTGPQLQVAALMLLHGLCAVLAERALLRHRKG